MILQRRRLLKEIPLQEMKINDIALNGLYVRRKKKMIFEVLAEQR